MPASLALAVDTAHPLDAFEEIADANDWMVERSGTDEISIIVDGSWTPLHLSLSWRDDLEGLHLACAFDLKVPAYRRTEVTRLLAQINERLVFGHFDIWFEEGSLMFRNGLMLGGGASPTGRQCERLLQQALEACERFFPAFQFVIWAGKTAEEAIEASLFDTAGNA